MINLIGSLLFGVGQLVVGAFLITRGARAGRWRRPRTFLTMLAGAWFMTSGAAELLVSGMEVAQRLGHGPSTPIFSIWRGRADTTLLIATVALVAVGLAYFLVYRAGLLARKQ